MVLFGFLFFFSLAFSKQIKKVLTFKVKGMENNGSKDVSRIETGKKRKEKYGSTGERDLLQLFL